MHTPTAEIIETAKRLITIPSTSDNPEALAAAVNVLTEMVERCPDITIERFERNGRPSFLAYQGKTRPAKFDILLNAHIDVVPGHPGQFQPTERDDQLYGRGALDMKGTAAALTAVFCEMAGQVPYALGLQIVSDEEVGGYDGVRLQIDAGVRANFVIMGEYANDRHTIYNAARGLCWAEIQFKGKAAHGGHPWHGDNAILKAGRFAAAVVNRYPTPTEETWTTTANIASLSTPNDTYNKVPDTATLKIDFRFTKENSVFHSRQSLEAFIANLDPEAKLINLAVFEPAVHVEQHNPYVQALSYAIQQVSGTTPHYLGRPASSDGRHFGLINTDIIEFGLYGRDPHGDNEHVELASFEEYRRTLELFLQQPIPHITATIPSVVEDSLPVRLLRQLVAIPSVSGDSQANNRALLVIEHFLGSRGMHIERYEHNGIGSLYATTRPGNRRPAVLLNAHTDVVPAPKANFNLTIDGDKLTGRGVMDMKFAIAAYLSLIDKLGPTLSAYDLGILITSDEEIGSRNGTPLIVKQHKLRPKVVIVPDGGENWSTETFAKGVQWIKLEATGKSAHASRPWEGASAIRPLLAAIRDIEELVPISNNRQGTSLSVGTIEGGTTGNQIPTQASAMLDIRYGNIPDFNEVYPRIKAICTRHGITQTLLVNDPPCSNNIDNPYIDHFRRLITEVTGLTPGTDYSYGATDGRFFGALGIPCVITTPESGGRHTDHEWLSLQGYEWFCEVLEHYVVQVAATPAAHHAQALGIDINT